jgi:hypothetical protein
VQKLVDDDNRKCSAQELLTPDRCAIVALDNLGCTQPPGHPAGATSKARHRSVERMVSSPAIIGKRVMNWLSESDQNR